MPVPTSITDLSTTAASNSPAGADAVFPNLDDYLRAHAAFIAQLNAADATKVAKAGDTMNGPLVLNDDPSATLEAATKGYVDTGLSGKAAAAHTHDWSVISSRLFAEGALTENADAFNYPVLLTNVGTPDANYWFVTTTRRDLNNVGQIAVGLNTGGMYARSKNSGVWAPWVRCDLSEGLTRSIGASGYLKLPGAGGLMIQWGSISHGGGGNVAVSFPIAFPNAAVAVVPNSVYNGGANNPSAHSKSASGFTCYWAGSVTITIDYIAIGY